MLSNLSPIMQQTSSKYGIQIEIICLKIQVIGVLSGLLAAWERLLLIRLTLPSVFVILDVSLELFQSKAREENQMILGKNKKLKDAQA